MFAGFESSVRPSCVALFDRSSCLYKQATKAGLMRSVRYSANKLS